MNKININGKLNKEICSTFDTSFDEETDSCVFNNKRGTCETNNLYYHENDHCIEDISILINKQIREHMRILKNAQEKQERDKMSLVKFSKYIINTIAHDFDENEQSTLGIQYGLYIMASLEEELFKNEPKYQTIQSFLRERKMATTLSEKQANLFSIYWGDRVPEMMKQLIFMFENILNEKKLLNEMINNIHPYYELAERYYRRSIIVNDD